MPQINAFPISTTSVDDLVSEIGAAKTSAETARDQAQAWAEGTLPGGVGTRSAREWAVDAGAKADEAEAARDVAAASAALALAGSPYRLGAFADLALRLRYSGAGSGEINVFAGDCIDVPGIGSYVVLSSSDTAPHLDYTGSGGVKLSILDLGISPAHFGAATDGSADAAAAVQAAFDAVVASWGAGAQSYQRILDGRGATFRVDSSLDMTGIQQNGLDLRNMKLVGRCAGKAVLDTSGSRNLSLTNVHVYGDPTAAPSVGILSGRILENSYAPAPQHRYINCSATGKYTIAALANLASEVCYEAGCRWSNTTLDHTAHAAIYCLNQAELARVSGKTIVSDYGTMITGWQGKSLTVIKCTGADVRMPHTFTLQVTAITNASPAVCTYEAAAPADFANDSHIFISAAPGMSGVALRSYVVKGHDANAKTFQLYDLDGTTPINTGAAGALSGPATLFNRTGAPIFLNGASQFDWDGYVLSYNDRSVVLAAATSDANEALFPSFVRFAVAAEKVARAFIDVDVGATNRTIRDLTLQFIDLANYEALVRRIGSGAVTLVNPVIRAGKATGSGLSGNVCNPASAFSVYGADFAFGNNAFFTPTGWASFSGTVREPRGYTLYGADRLTFAGNGVALTGAGMRRSATARYSLWRDGAAAECHIQYQDSSTQTNLRSLAAVINTQDKWPGKQAWDVSNNRPVWASGATAASVWVDAAGTTVHTPV